MPSSRPALLATAAAVLALAAAGCAGRRPVETAAPLTIRPLATAASTTPEDPPASAAAAGAGDPAPGPQPVASEVGGIDSTVAAAGTAAPAAEAGPAARAGQLPPPVAGPHEHPAGVPATAVDSAPRPSLHQLCHQEGESGFLDESRRLLTETFCGATLWFDGLFGGEPDLHNARAVSGRVELSTLHTDFEGLDYKGRLRLNYDLPNLERRVRLFLGRDEEDEFVADRQEGFAIRSSVFGLEGEEAWLAGLGYSPPGRYLSKFDVRLGGRIKSAPEIFTQLRYRQNVFMGEHDVLRFRETVFYENRDGFGSTTSLDWDRVLRRDLVFRWGSVGTISEATEGLAWRSATLLYHNLGRWENAAVAGEVFVRGETDDEVPLREYGTRAIYRQPFGRPYLFGEVIVGYTWPRERTYEERKGSMMLGLGVELLFGRDPY